MKKYLLHGALVVLACALSARDLMAVEFTIVGPRAVGMGGAGVAVTDDALATYWNPAGLAVKKTIDIRAQGSIHGVDRLGIEDTLQDIRNINRTDTSAANQAQLQGLVDKLARPGTSVSGAAAGGLYAKATVGNHAIGLNVSDVATGGAFFPTVDRTVTVSGGTINNNTQLAVRALEARQVGLSYATALAGRRLFIGTTVKVIQGAAYSNQTGIFTTDGLSFAKNLGKARIGTGFGLDVGALYRPVSSITVGVVGKDLNEPTFDTPDGGQFTLARQVRGGIAVNPYSSLALTFDGDILSNSTLLNGVKSRVLSVGAEQTLFSEMLALRVGALKNVEDAATTITPTAGLGFRLFAVRMDLGAGYDFRERQALGSFSVAMTF